MKLRLIAIALAAALPLGAHAEDLLQVYRDARGYDAQYAAARYGLEAGREKLPQGKALLLPTLNLSGSATDTRTDFQSNDPAQNPSFVRDARAYGGSLNFSQPIYRKQNFIQYDEAGYQVKQAEASFSQASQDLIVRVAQAYFDVLAARDTLELVGAQKAAISEQLAQAKRNFEVGTATIVDTHEAQARYDLVVAQEILAQNDLDVKKRTLQQITGKEYAALAPLRLGVDVKLAMPTPNDMQAWVDMAEKQSYAVQVQEAITEISRLEAERNAVGHYPTLDLVASYGQVKQSGTLVTPIGSNVSSAQVGLQLGVPLYQGGAISSREREAAFNYDKAKQDLENARRSAALAAQQAFLASVNGVAQVKALEQALVSSQSSLDSNKLGYEVGVRINIDVLNAQQQLYQTRRDLALARYNLITSRLKLQAAGGVLTEQDLERVNAALVP
jgi:outer membrane protein